MVPVPDPDAFSRIDFATFAWSRPSRNRCHRIRPPKCWCSPARPSPLPPHSLTFRTNAETRNDNRQERKEEKIITESLEQSGVDLHSNKAETAQAFETQVVPIKKSSVAEPHRFYPS